MPARVRVRARVRVGVRVRVRVRVGIRVRVWVRVRVRVRVRVSEGLHGLAAQLRRRMLPRTEGHAGLQGESGQRRRDLPR